MEAAESSKTSVVARANSEQSWWQWVDARMDYRLDAMGKEVTKAVGQALGEFRAQAREHCEREVGIVKRELELTRRELTVLREEVGVERGLHDLRAEVAEAREQVPKLPAIVADLEAEQARLERELTKTKDRLSKVRVDQSIANYNLAELCKQAEASNKASIEMEFESTNSRFQMKATHPDAAKALQKFASEIINGQADGTLWLPGRAGNA
jgi:chromosome segregation ATPase